ncbi:hypothetical protein G3576_00175 [Roseomonas stagni]|uniref:Uncharacterized protein n=1 Tax=Falsiroseomonas algicola TaxID=2716930 RepID=A0A6M1LE11_9PROT|nr:hypothetical protein [Falsiroseomonas algicola]NGM18411.1 hypothetical protein [Falsiroseomonas algicola]
MRPGRGAISPPAMRHHRRSDQDTRTGRLARPRILLPSIPWPVRRVAGMWMLGLTLWMASILALFR